LAVLIALAEDADDARVVAETPTDALADAIAAVAERMDRAAATLLADASLAAAGAAK